MNRIQKLQPKDPNALDLIGFNVLPLEWNRVKEIMAEYDQSERLLRDALRAGHGIELDLHDILECDQCGAAHADRQKEEFAGVECPECGKGTIRRTQNNPTLYFVVDQAMKEKLAEYKINNPTLLQLIGTSLSVGKTKEEAEAKFRELMQT